MKDPGSMSNFHYVYILVDEATGTHFYIGCTEDLKSRAAFLRFRLGKPVAQQMDRRANPEWKSEARRRQRGRLPLSLQLT